MSIPVRYRPDQPIPQPIYIIGPQGFYAPENLQGLQGAQGQASDIGQGQRLVELTPTGTQAFMADKFYDCDWLIDAIEQENMIAVIPSKSNRITPRQRF